MKDSHKAHLALLSANIIYGANYSIAKLVMPSHLQPSAFILMRVITATLLFWITSAVYVNQKIDRNDFRKLFICAVFGIAANQLLFFQGLSHTSPIHASIMMLFSPVLVVILSKFIRKEKFTTQQYLGLSISFMAAAWLVVANTSRSGGEATIYGDFCVLLNALSWGYYLVIVQDMMRKYHTIVVMKWVFFFGTFMVFPFGISDLLSAKWFEFSSGIWWAILYVTVVTTYLAYILNNYALKAHSPALVSNYIYTQPIIASIVSIGLGKDEINLTKIICTVFVILGVYMVSNRR